MKENRHGGHTRTRLSAPIVWWSKYCYHVLTGDILLRRRDWLLQIGDAEDARILIGIHRICKMTQLIPD